MRRPLQNLANEGVGNMHEKLCLQVMKREEILQLFFCNLQLERRKMKPEFFKQINAVMGWNPLHRLIELSYGRDLSPTGRPATP